MKKDSSFDFFRIIPKDLTEGSTHGSILSMIGVIFMMMVFVSELAAFLTNTPQTNVFIDTRSNSEMQINFNITVFDVPCEFATIDAFDILGTIKSNITKDINKWRVDDEGLRRSYEGRNQEQEDIFHDENLDIDLLLRNGIHAATIGEEEFESTINSKDYTFINYYAPWCEWCQKLLPVWESLAEEVEKEYKDKVTIVNVNCEENILLCTNQKILVFPTLKLYKKVKDARESDEPFIQIDYGHGLDRNVESIMNFLLNKLSIDSQVEQLKSSERFQHYTRIKMLKDKTDHPGCMLSGTLNVNSVPGSFHIEARSKYHNINPTASNISHIVNNLSFGKLLSKRTIRNIEFLSKDYFSLKSTTLMNDNVYISDKLHQSYHHYIKVVPTYLEINKRTKGKNAIVAYQMVQSSQIMQYQKSESPGARFTYDLSPISVSLTMKGKKWYEFVTSICAIIGGTYTALGLVSSFYGTVFANKKIM